MRKANKLLQYIQQFFQDYLAAHRGLSPNTIMAYRDALKLFLGFVAQWKNKSTTKLTLDDLTADVVLTFLKDIENTRNNSIGTRNLRLAALRTFFTYLSAQDPFRVGQYQRIIAIQSKRTSKHMVEYLEVHEVKAILNTIDQQTPSGERDYVMLNLLYNTGARVQEICDLRINSLRLGTPSLVTITGKGGKTRQVPLWSETVKLLENYLARRNLLNNPPAHLFLNSRGEPLGRFGIRHIIQKRVAAAISICPSLVNKKISPHMFRHTTAMHLLQAGVDLTVIKTWLGHVNLSTTHSYIEIDLEMKRKALAACGSVVESHNLKQLIRKNEDVIAWLETL